MTEIFQKPEISLFTLPFSTDMGLDFCIFLAKCKKSNESNIYIYIYIYIYERETSVCMCYTIKVKQKTQRLFDEFSYSFNT